LSRWEDRNSKWQKWGRESAKSVKYGEINLANYSFKLCQSLANFSNVFFLPKNLITPKRPQDGDQPLEKHKKCEQIFGMQIVVI
jgi:hypothetical protein